MAMCRASDVNVSGKELKQVHVPVQPFCYLGAVFDSLAVKETSVNQIINQYGKTLGLLYLLPRDCNHIQDIITSDPDTVKSNNE